MQFLEPFEFLDVAPRLDSDLRLILAEHLPAENSQWGVPVYTFTMEAPDGEQMGRICLRVGWSEEVIRYAGHVGYAVQPGCRGHRYAERACQLIPPLARCHAMASLWITCQPDNIAGGRTFERPGAEYVGVVNVPSGYPMDAGAEQKKMCFSLALE